MNHDSSCQIKDIAVVLNLKQNQVKCFISLTSTTNYFQNFENVPLIVSSEGFNYSLTSLFEALSQI